MPIVSPEWLASLAKNSVGMYTPRPDDYMFSPQVYKVTIYDEGGQGMHQEIVVAMALMDGIDTALALFNNGYRMRQEPLSREAVVAIENLTEHGDQLIFSIATQLWLKDFHGDTPSL